MGLMPYIGNLARSITENELRNLFSRVGEVASVRIMTDRISGVSKQYGFLAMSSQSEAGRAVSLFNHYSLSEHALKVGFAGPRSITGTTGTIFEL